MKKLSELKSLGNWCSNERGFVSDLLVELGLAEEDKKEESKYQVGDIWKFKYSNGEEGKMRIDRISGNEVYGIKIYNTGGIFKNGLVSEINRNLTELLWRDPK